MAFTQQGTGFSNLQKIVDANSDNKLGSTIQGGIQNQADSTKSSLNGAYGQFQNDVNKNSVDTTDNRNQVTNTINRFGGGDPQQIDLGKGGFDEKAAQPGQPTTPGPYGAPSSKISLDTSPDISNLPLAPAQPAPSLNGGDVSAFEKFRSGTYSGPQQIADISNIQNQAQDVQQLGQSVNNSGGRQSLLQRFIGGNQYTQGQQNLDNLLLGATGSPNLQSAQQATRGIVNQVNQADSNAKAMANQTASQNRAFADFTNQSIANAYDPQNAQLNTNVANTQTTEDAREAKVKALADMLSKDNSPDTAKASIKQLGDMGLISNVDPGPGKNGSDPNSVDGLTYDGGGNYFQPIKTFRDKDGEYLTELPDGSHVYSSGPNSGKVYHSPGYDPGSDLTQWNTLIDSLTKFNKVAPEQVNYNNILQQAIGDTKAQNITRSGVANSQQASRLNALNQLAGRQQEFTDPTAVGKYQGGSQAFNQAQALQSIKAITNPGATAASSDPSAPEQLNGIAADTWGGIGKGFDGVGLNGVGTTFNDIGQGIQKGLNNLTGPGDHGTGKIICNELHRQGYISDEIIALDEAYGKKYRKYYREAYLGYLVVAQPIVSALQKYPVLAPFMMVLTKPWSQYMANIMDSSIPGSRAGKIIHEVGIRILPIVYKVNKFWKQSKLKTTNHS